jgi:hypothetical protein
MSSVTSNRARYVILDDDDRAIVYQGSWEVDTNPFDENTAFGYVYGGSQQKLLRNEGTMALRFKGGFPDDSQCVVEAEVETGTGDFVVFGTSDALNRSGIYDPSFSCRMDGFDIPPETPLRGTINHWPLCIGNATDVGDHVLTVTANSTTRPFFIDYIIYRPDYEDTPRSPTVIIASTDLAVDYVGGSWNSITGGMSTVEAGANMTITFTGGFYLPLNQSCSLIMYHRHQALAPGSWEACPLTTTAQTQQRRIQSTEVHPQRSMFQV